jgi:hypothetical protein
VTKVEELTVAQLVNKSSVYSFYTEPEVSDGDQSEYGSGRRKFCAFSWFPSAPLRQLKGVETASFLLISNLSK